MKAKMNVMLTNPMVTEANPTVMLANPTVMFTNLAVMLAKPTVMEAIHQLNIQHNGEQTQYNAQQWLYIKY